MSLIDPECHSFANVNDERVCSGCFDNQDLIEIIKSSGSPGICSYCERRRRYTSPRTDISSHINERLCEFYGKAVEQLPYESREGGYQGNHFDTYDLLYDTVGLSILSPGIDALYDDLVCDIGHDLWCDFDWLSLDYDVSLSSSWDDFTRIVKAERRFFFHRYGQHDALHHPDERSVHEFLCEFANLVDELGIIRSIGSGYLLFRARPRSMGQRFSKAMELGPPPSDVARQSNRMNPPGIPMFYGSETRRLAVAETRNARVSIGAFETTKSVRVLDFAGMPELLPGIRTVT